MLTPTVRHSMHTECTPTEESTINEDSEVAVEAAPNQVAEKQIEEGLDAPTTSSHDESIDLSEGTTTSSSSKQRKSGFDPKWFMDFPWVDLLANDSGTVFILYLYSREL